jgi:purine-nucleoside phosphorylase
VAHAVRTAAAAGARTLLLTNANGSFRGDWGTGTGVLLADHLNLSGSSPLEGPRFVDLSEPYASRLRDLARAADPALVEGTYVMLRGPHYETVAEARALTRLGAHVVGMSTVLETIAGRERGLEVLGLSVVTVVEASGEEIDPDAVVAQAASAATGFGAVLRHVCSTA